MKYFILLFVVVFGLHLQAQINNVNLKKGYFLNQESFFYVTKDSVNLIHYSTQYNADTKKIETNFSSNEKFKNISEILNLYNITEKDLIKISDLINIKKNPIINGLKSKQFNFVNRDTKFNVLDDEYGVFRIFKEGKLFGSYVVYLYPININNKYTIFKLFNTNFFDKGYLIPTKNKIIIDNFYNNDKIVLENINKNDSIELREIIKLQYPEGILFKEKNKYGIKTRSGNKELVKSLYDTIYYDNNLIVGKIGNRVHLFYRNGEQIDIPNIRAIRKTNNNGFSILKDNKTYWLTKEGTISEFPLNDFYENMMCKNAVKKINIIKEKDSFILRFEINDKSIQNKLLTDNKKINNVFFLNTTQEFIPHSLCYRNYNPYSYDYIVETSDNLKSIIQVEKDEIKYLLTPDNYKFTFIYNQLLRFESGNLIGLYPFQKKTKYISLSEFEKGFARFQLENGMKGWIDIEGNEYLDD